MTDEKDEDSGIAKPVYSRRCPECETPEPGHRRTCSKVVALIAGDVQSDRIDPLATLHMTDSLAATRRESLRIFLLGLLDDLPAGELWKHAVMSARYAEERCRGLHAEVALTRSPALLALADELVEVIWDLGEIRCRGSKAFGADEEVTP